MKMNFRSLLLAIGLAFLAGLAACSSSSSNSNGGLQDVIQLPAGFQPEGVAISGTKLYTGSIPTGRIFKADITTGQGQVLVDPGAGRNSIGMKVDSRGRLFVAGGQTGKAYVYDAETGADHRPLHAGDRDDVHQRRDRHARRRLVYRFLQRLPV